MGRFPCAMRKKGALAARLRMMLMTVMMVLREGRAQMMRRRS